LRQHAQYRPLDEFPLIERGSNDTDLQTELLLSVH
jgi:hypothetical protein